MPEQQIHTLTEAAEVLKSSRHDSSPELCLYVDDRLVYATYDGGGTQVLTMNAEDLVALHGMLGE